MRKIHFHKNDRGADRPFFMVGHLPIRQTLVWIGPLFIRIAPKQVTR